MATAIEKLMYKIGIIDQMSAPARRISQSISGMQRAAQTGFKQLATGVAAMVGAGYTAQKLAAPAVEMADAMGDLASINVPTGVLRQLDIEATAFAAQYGGSATEVVKASMAIRNGIRTMADEDLPAFARANALLAKATKADTTATANYLATMYGRFQQTADAMGRQQWLDQLTGQTALAAKLFRTDTAQMAAAFKGLGTLGAAQGFGQAEQIGILGTLQQSMDAGEAASRYKAFLTNLGRANQMFTAKAKTSFLDANGAMLPTADILDRINRVLAGKSTAQQTDILTQTFGAEGMTIVQLLRQNVGGLREDIAALANVGGNAPAVAMAEAMTQSTERWSAAVANLQRVLGAAVLTALEPLIRRGAALTAMLAGWLQAHPRLAAVIGGTIVAVLALTAAIGLFTAAMGVVSLVHAGILAVKSLALILRSATIAQWAMNIAMYANPVGLIIVGVVALIAVLAGAIYAIRKGTGWVKVLGYVVLASLGPIGWIIAGIITYWDEFAAAAQWVGRVVAAAVGTMWRILSRIGLAILESIVPLETLVGWWGIVKAAVVDTFTNLRQIGGQVLGWIGSAFKWYFALVLDGLKTMLGWAAKIPGVGKGARIALEEIGKTELSFKATAAAPGPAAAAAPPRPLPPATAPRELAVPAGGLRQQVQPPARSATYGDVYISSRQGPGPAQLAEWMDLQYG
jgi:TP901 family phage tail tape measure protein